MRKQILAFGLMAATASMAAVISDFEKDTQADVGPILIGITMALTAMV